MKRNRVYCFVDYIEVGGPDKNIVYYIDTGGFATVQLASCLNCGELFAYHEEDLVGISNIKQLAIQKICPNCKVDLVNTLEKYPDSFRTQNGNIAHIEKIPYHTFSNIPRIEMKVWVLIE